MNLTAEIHKAIRLLQGNQLVAIPTETVYGLAGNAYSEEAILKIFKTKNRPTFDPLIVHTHSIEKMYEFVKEIPEQAKLLFEKFSPGALTVLLPKKPIIPDLVTSGLPHVAVRIPNHPITLALLRELDFPLAAPSANPFGYISPTTADHVRDQLGDKISLILEGGNCQIGLESTIVGFENQNPVILRLGGISVEEIETVIGKVSIRQSSSSPNAPGMLLSHYAPKKKMIVGDIKKLMTQHKINTAILSFSERYAASNNLVLSENKNINEAAQNLFQFMRILDSQVDTEIILAEYVPQAGLGLAINDRLKRAAHTY